MWGVVQLTPIFVWLWTLWLRTQRRSSFEKFDYLGIAQKVVFPNIDDWYDWFDYEQSCCILSMSNLLKHVWTQPLHKTVWNVQCSFSHDERYLFKEVLLPLSNYTPVNICNSEKHNFTFHLVIMKDTFSKTCFYLFQTVLLYIFVFYDS